MNKTILFCTEAINRDKNSILRRAMELEVEGRRPVNRPKGPGVKQWKKT